MKKPAPVVRIATPQGSTVLSKGQKTFNRLIKKIEEQRQRLQAWQDTLPSVQARQAGEYAPVLSRYNELRVQLVQLFDAASDAPGLTKTERAKLSDLIASILNELLSADASPELIALYDKHNGATFADEEKMAAESARNMLKNMFDLEIGDDTEINSPEDVAALLQKKMLEEHEAQQSAQADKRSQRKPSAKTLAREAQQREEAQGASQSIREVFRKLASGLHPDREPDAQERARKTVLMQRVNAAYEKNDLLALLQLQLEVEQIDHADIGALSEARLKHYNKVLTEQLAELEDEIAFIEAPFDDADPLDPRPPRRVRPAQVLQRINEDIAHLKAATLDVEHDLQRLVDIKHLKAMLKHYRIERGDPFGLHDLF